MTYEKQRHSICHHKTSTKFVNSYETGKTEISQHFNSLKLLGKNFYTKNRADKDQREQVGRTRVFGRDYCGHYYAY